MRALRVGTRKSPLAMKQTEIVIKALKQVQSLEIEIVGISTKGDRLQKAPLSQIGTDPLKWDSIKKAFLLGYRLPIFYR